MEALGRAWDRPLVRRHDDYIHAGFRSPAAAPDGSLELVSLDLVAAPNIVLTVRDGPVVAFDGFRDEIDGMTQWPGLLDRLDTTLGAIETARELLLGTYDLLMTRVAQRTNETVKVLTVVSVALMPAALISSVLGMSFRLPFFDTAANFWVSVGFMAALVVGTVAIVVLRNRG